MANQRIRAHLWEGSFWAYNYDSYGQVISGKKSWRDDSRVAGQQFEYVFDAIGNRLEARRGGDGAGGGLRLSAYTANGLNQYTERTNPGYYDVIGLASSGASVNINGSSAGVERKGEYFRKELQVNNTSGQYPAVAVEASDGVNTGGPISGHLFVPPATESCTHDEDGNLAQDGRWDYTWDAENRLVKLESRSNAPGGSARRIEFGYDWRGRRVWRKVTNLGDNSVEERKYIYDGWNLYAEFDGNGALVQSYVWGPDLSGDAPSRQQRAGGVGGLVGVKPAGAAIHFVAYDGNGNVAGLVDGSTGEISAWYEYGPFGEPIRVSGAMAKLNPFRFSTKYTDEESGFLYYGYRYYNPETGRWLNRDPINEKAFVIIRDLQILPGQRRIQYYKLASEERRSRLQKENNLYCFVENQSIGNIDPLGLDVYKVEISADLPSGGSSVNHREVVGDDGDGGIFVASFNQDPDKGFHLFGASCCGRGSVTVSHYKSTSAEEWIKDAKATVKVHLVTGYPEIDQSLSKMADGYGNYHPTYVLGFNDCGSIANKFMKEAKDRIDRFTDSHFSDGFPF